MDVDTRIILLVTILLGVVLLAYKKEHILAAILYVYCALAVVIASIAFMKASALSAEEYRQLSLFRDSSFWLDVVVWIPMMMLLSPLIYHHRSHMIQVLRDGYKIHAIAEKTMLNIYIVFCLVLSSAMFVYAIDFFIRVIQ